MPKFAIAALLALAPVALLVALFGRGPVLAPLPWAEAVTEAFTILVGCGIAYFCLGRYKVLGETSSVWIGAGFLGYALLALLYLLVYPQLLFPQPVLALHPNAWAWPFHAKWTVLAAFLFVAPFASQPSKDRSEAAWRVYGAAVLLVSLLAAVFVGLGAWLPALVEGDRFTPLNIAWTASLALMYALAAGSALYHGVRRGQPVLVYAAVMAAVLAVRLGDDIAGGQLYDTVWYLNRVLVITAFSAMLLGIAQDHLSLLGRERSASRLARERAAELQAIFDSMTDAVLVLDERGHVADANASALKLLGLHDKERARRPVLEHRDRLRLTSLNPLLPMQGFPSDRALQGETVRNFLCRSTPETGRERLIEINASPVTDGQAVSGAVLVIRDVTELEWARGRASLARLATAVASTHTLPDLVESVLSETRQVLGADAVVLFEVRPPRLVMLGQHGGGARFAEALSAMDFALDSTTITVNAVRLRTVQVLPDLSEAPPDYERARDLGEHFGFRAAVAVPLLVRERALGAVLCLYLAPRRLSNQEMETVGTIGGIVAIGLDNVRLYEQAENERRRLLAVIEQSPEGILLFEPRDGKLILSNAAAQALVEVPVDVRIPTSERPQVYGLARPDGSPFPPAELPSARALAGEVVHGEEMLLTGGTRAARPVLSNAAPVRDHAGRIMGAVVILHDISRIKALERQREEFVSIIAHDLRTPIGVIQNYAEVLRLTMESRGAGADESKAAGAIAVSAGRLAGMVNDLLDMSRIESERLSLSLQAVSLAPLAQNLVERLTPMLPGHPVRSRIATDVPMVWADPSRVEQILINLLTNAAKYSPEGSPIELSVERENGHALLSVHDRGQGIAPEDQRALFDKFFRTRSARGGGKEGAGLGLYICRGLVEAHGGRIWVESSPGAGSAFRFTLPAASA